MSLLVGTGGILTLVSAAALAFGYAPALFVRPNPALQTLSINAKGCGGTSVELNSDFDEPTALASTVGVNVSIQNIARCKSYWIAAQGAVTVRLLSSEAVFAGEQREVIRSVPFKAGTTPNSRVFEFDTKGLSQYWFVRIEQSFHGYRTGFDRYAVAGNLSLGLGDWKVFNRATSEYATTGETELAKTVSNEARPEDFDLSFNVTATFARITEYKDIFIILISTLLGVATSSLVQGAATTPKRSRRRASSSGFDA